MVTASLVVPVRGDSGILCGLLQSIEEQTELPDEIIFVVSTDDIYSAELICDWKILRSDLCIQLLVREPKGIADARQYGSEFTCGDIIAYTDADSVLCKDWFFMVKSFFQNTDVDFVYGKVILDDLNLPSSILQGAYNIIPYLRNVGVHPIVGSNMAIRKSAFNEVGGFDTSIKFGEDNDLGMKCKRRHYAKDAVVHTSNRRVNTWGKLFYLTFMCIRYILGSYAHTKFHSKEYLR